MQEPASTSHNRPTRAARFFNYVHRYKNLLRRRWWVLPCTMAIGLGIKIYALATAPPAFISVGRMIVSIKVQIPTGSLYTEELSNFLGTQQKLMTSGIVRNKAAERVFAAKPNLAPVDVDYQITVSPKTTIFNLQATAAEPEYCRAYLDACMDEYINLKTEMRTKSSDKTLASIADQLGAMERDLKKQEEELINFQATNSVVFLQEQGNSAGSYLVQLNRQLATLKMETQLLEMLSDDQILERQQKKGTPAATSDEVSATDSSINFFHSDYLKAKQEIQLRKAELLDWSETHKPKHPRIIALNEEIAHRERLLNIYKQQSLEQLGSRRSDLALQIQNLEREIKEWEIKSLDVSKKMADYERIRANKQRIQGLYERLLGAVQTLGVDKDISQESMAILERASPARPARANAAQALIIGGVLGLLAGMALLLLLDRFDDRPLSFTDLQESFDEPVLGQIPLERWADRRKPLPLIQPHDERHAFVEAYRNLRSSLLYMATEGKRPRTLVVTSAIPADGKSMTTSNLAITMAQGGARVLLVDADLRRGALHHQFGVSATPGLDEVLAEGFPWQQSVQPTFIPTLWLLPRGKISRNPGEMFLNQSTRILIDELAKQYDYVIIDTAPVMAADDVTSLSPHVEGVLFVIRAGYTSARVARAALDLLYQREVDVLGLVFNRVDTSASEYYYYKYKNYYAKPARATPDSSPA